DGGCAPPPGIPARAGVRALGAFLRVRLQGAPGRGGRSPLTFPATRMRRLRAKESFRALVRETRLSPGSLVAPLFVCHGQGVRRPIASMPGHAQISVDVAVEEAKKLAALGVGGVILFGIPASKDPEGSEAYDPEGIVPRAFRAIKAAGPEILLWADVCLCEYTDHGHCGIVREGVV